MRTRPRLRWCPSGNLTSLPLHTAGAHYGENMDNASNYFVPSYINADIETKILLSIVPPSLQVEVPGTSLLPLASESITHPALKFLSSASILHIGCHAHQDRGNLLDGGFELSNGRLAIGHLMQARNPHAQLAYVSAFQSAIHVFVGKSVDHVRSLALQQLFLVAAQRLLRFVSLIDSHFKRGILGQYLMLYRHQERLGGQLRRLGLRLIRLGLLVSSRSGVGTVGAPHHIS
jgi:hypothetical protein